ncbi:hypothetical protein HFO98_09105 [Rhizobium leguminosarum]|uniref:hypothetical protein n=1 Tax=Rhizobium leguminosarum TaxID=384 RepID=UPI001C98DFD2|nr:hypothetical protein [Rhizobium leguminosarum]MBY5408629.1 hypothetical protein [Rhizobium leguminosarum]
MREQPIGEAVENDEWTPSGVMWPPETEIAASDVHESLVKAVAGSRGVRFFTAYLIDVPSDASLGAVQVAIDEVAGVACGIYLTVRIAGFAAETGEPILVDEATEVLKFPHYTNDTEMAISTFCEKIRAAGTIR